MAGRLTREQHEFLIERVMPPLPIYHGPFLPSATDASIETPLVAPTDNIAEGSNTQPRASTTRTSPTSSNPVVEQQMNLYFPHPDSSTTTSSSEIERPLSSHLSEGSSSSDEIERSSTPPIVPSTSTDSSTEITRSTSPTGSDDSSETVTGFIDSEGRPIIAIRNNR